MMIHDDCLRQENDCDKFEVGIGEIVELTVSFHLEVGLVPYSGAMREGRDAFCQHRKKKERHNINNCK